MIKTIWHDGESTVVDPEQLARDIMDDNVSMELVINPATNASMYSNPDQAYNELMQALGSNISDEEKQDAIKKMTARYTIMHSEWLEKLLNEEASITTSALSNITGIGRSSLDKTLSMDRSLPKWYFFALALVFRFSKERVINDAKILGIEITNDIPDVIFMKFIEASCYELDSYVKAVRRTYKVLYDQTDYVITHQPFFDKDYENVNIELVTK